jgi:A/G-specific adenine glycosylase
MAVVDGNVERVLRRLFGRELAGEALWTAAQNLLDSAQPAEFNQAMMELGATVCLPGVPRCGACPLKQFCISRDGRCQADIGKPRTVEPRRRRSGSIFVVRRGNSVLLRQRSHLDSLMPDMWELPQSYEQPRREPLIEVKHSITTTDWHVRVFSCHQMRKTARMQWVRIGEVSNLPLTGLTRKVLRRLKVLA